MYVIPYGTNCRFPADLVLARLRMELHISGEHSNAGEGSPPAWGIRLPATFLLSLSLLPRLREDWQDIACATGVSFANDDPYDLTTVPRRPIVVASDGCSQVPLEIRWRGINGPRPWSRSQFDYQGPPCSAGTCCDFLYALDGLVIPGEVNDTGDVDAPQRYEGDVVLMLNQAPDIIGCGCP